MLAFGKTMDMDHSGAGVPEAHIATVKIAGQEFVPQSSDSLKAFEAFRSKAMAEHQLIPIGDGTFHAPATSPTGEFEMLKAEVQLRYGWDPITATKALKAAGVSPPSASPYPPDPTPAKTFLMKGKAKVADQGDTSTDQQPPAYKKPWRGPR